MPKVVMFSDFFLPTFPELEVRLYKELKKRCEKLGFDVLYVLQEKDIRLENKEFGHKDIIYKNEDGKCPRDTVAVANLVSHGDVFVCRFDYKYEAAIVATLAKKNGAKVFMYDPAAIDIRVRECPADYITAKSEYMKQEILKKFKRYKDIFVTGTIHFDDAAIIEADRTEFVKKYQLDPSKKIALLTPANPAEGNHQVGVDKEYSKIASIVKNQCPDYELMIKGHPLDYTAKMERTNRGVILKHEYYKGAYSWEKFAPGAKVVDADEGYKALKVCDVVLNVRSSIAMETPLFYKPLLNINRTKYTTNWPYSTEAMMDIKMEDLATVLNTNNYSVSVEGCNKYIAEHCFANDGKAYIRTADAIIKVLKDEV